MVSTRSVATARRSGNDFNFGRVCLRHGTNDNAGVLRRVGWEITPNALGVFDAWSVSSCSKTTSGTLHQLR